MADKPLWRAGEMPLVCESSCSRVTPLRPSTMDGASSGKTSPTAGGPRKRQVLRATAEAGGLMSYGVNLRGSFRHASVHAVEILRARHLATTAEIRLRHQPPGFGLTMPETLLVQTPEVIE
jgi:hypothetical protein